MTARDSSTAKGNARFFAVEAGAGALFCVEEIEWTIVEVSEAMFDVGVDWASREELIVPTPLPKRLVDVFAVLVWTARRGDIIQTLTLQAALEGINR